MGKITEQELHLNLKNKIDNKADKVYVDGAVNSVHTQNTDTGTNNSTFQLDNDNNGVKLKNNSGVLEIRNSSDSDYADLIINKLTIRGDTTEIQSEIVNIADNILTLNSNVTSGTPTENAGFQIKRGNLTNASFIWDESNDKFKAGLEGSEQSISLEGHNHIIADIDNLQTVLNNKTNNISDINAIDLTDGGDTSLHYHSTDRNRTNHTGTQSASTISDFASTVRSTALTGLSTATNAVVSAADSILTALGKLQKQITDHLIDSISHITASERTNWNVAHSNNHTHSNKLVLDNTTASFSVANATKLDGISPGANKVETSLTNGNIKIDGVEKTAYAHPSGTNPHGTTKADIGLSNADNTSDSSKNVLSASKLTTARTINGVSFDGTSNITIADSTKEPVIATKNTAFNVNFETTATNIKMDGTQSSGSLSTVARADHVHPTDTSRAGTSVATTGANGLMSSTDKTKLEGIASGANSYTHPSGDGNLHVPATGTANNTKVLKAGSTAGSVSWSNVDWSEVTNKPSSFAPSSHNHPINEITNLQSSLDSKASLTSPAFTGTPTAPTATSGTNTIQVATTAFVQNALSTGGYGDMLKSQFATNAKVSYGYVDKAILADSSTNADTVENLHALDFARAYSSSYAFGGNQTDITTADFITLLNGLGAFDSAYWVARGSWSYANNRIISDTGIGRIHLAGSTVEVIGSSSSYTIRIQTPTTTSGGTINTDYVYTYNGDTYSPSWRKLWNNKNSGSGSGLDSDLLDGKEGSYYLDYNNQTNKPVIPSQTSQLTNNSGFITSSASITGNAATATKLQTARTINGVSFDGSANITLDRINGIKVAVAAIAPSSPVTNDIWIDLN